jgi:hypothetical protein
MTDLRPERTNPSGLTGTDERALGHDGSASNATAIREALKGPIEPVNVTAGEAARILGGWSARSVYRYGDHLGMRRFGRSVRFDRATVVRVAFEGLPASARSR